MTESKSAGKKRKWPYILGFFLGVALLAVALLPTILSTQSGKQLVLTRIDPSIPGELMVGDWSLSWLGNQTLTGLSYDDPESGIELAVDSISIATGLSRLLLNRGDLGTITVNQPALLISLPEPQGPTSSRSEPADTGQPRPSAAQSSGSANTTEPEPGAIALPPISGRLLVQQGRVDIARHDKNPETAAKDVSIEIDMPAPTEPIAYALRLVSPDGTGTISADGNIRLELSGAALENVQPSGVVSITAWPLSQFLDLAALYASVPRGNAALSAQLNFDGDLAEAIDFSGAAELNDLNLSGGPLHDDKLVIDKTTVDFSALKRPASFELSSLTIDSPLAAGRLAATPAGPEGIDVDADLSIDLPEIAGQLPATLNLQEGLQISGGVLALKASARLGAEQKEFRADASVDGLAGMHEGKKIALDEPFSFTIIGNQSSTGLRLDKLVLDSSFINGTGRGDLNDLDISIKADLGAALRELSKFVSLQDYQARGQIDLSVTATRKDEQRVAFAARIDADQLEISQGTTTIIPRSPLRISAESMLALSADFVFRGAGATSLHYQSWLGSGGAAAGEILIDDNRRVKSIAGLDVDSQLSFSPLTTMLHNFSVLPGDVSMAGSGNLQLKLSGTDNRYLIEQFSLDAPTFSLSVDKTPVIPAAALKINGRTEISLDGDGTIKAITNPAVDYATWLGNGALNAASVDVSSGSVKTMNYQGNTDLEKLSGLLASLELLPPDLSFGGFETSSMTMDYSVERIDLAELHTEIDNLVLQQAGKTYRDERLVLDTAGTIVMEHRQASLRPLSLDSAHADVSFEYLEIGDWNRLPDTLNSDGQARFSLADILAAAADWISLPAGVETAAQVDLAWKAEAQPDNEHRYQLSTKLNELKLDKDEVQIFVNEDAALDLSGSRNMANGSLTIDQLTLASSPLDINSSGFYTPSETGNTELSFQGNLTMDLARLAALIRTLSDIELEMAGTSEQPFQLAASYSPEQRPRWYQHTSFSTVFVADLIRLLGLEIRSLEVPVTLADGIGRADISASVNEGALQLKPRLDLLSSPPLLTLPEDSRVIDRMQITREMANQLLARIHPLFRGASEMSGAFDLDLARFNWPVGEENLNEVTFAGQMEFYEVRLRTSTLIESLLDVMKVEDKELDLHERTIEFVCQDGRITTNALKTDLGDSELMISGSLGLDGTIDYLAQIPVTQQLVGGDLYDILEGTTIRVPIGGTLSEPDVSSRTVQRAVGDLVKQAGQKKIEEAATDLLKRLF